MSNLLASLSTSGNALNIFQQALDVVQNNVSNASTPGYAKQQINLTAMPFDVAGGLAGGVAARGLSNSRDEYAEEAVRSQTQLLGQYTAQSQATDTIQSFFDASGTSGVPAAFNNLLQSFSAWSATPNDGTARQTVLSSAAALADSIRGLSDSLGGTAIDLDGQIGSTVSQINNIATQIQAYNHQRLTAADSDPGTDAQVHNALETLSQFTDFTAVTQSDGTITVLLNGGAPLVIGDQQYPISANIGVDQQPPPINLNSPPTSHILDWQGHDITAQVAGGQLGGLLDVRNRVLPSMIGDSQQAGSLNQFAKSLADTVNQILQAGTVSSESGAANGAALFTYDASDATAVAASLRMNSAISPDQLAPVDSTGVANGNATLLASLGSSTSKLGLIGGLTLGQYFARITSNAGQENQTAANSAQAQQQVVAQAKSLRDRISGVSLDEEAINVMKFQRAYQAAAQVITVLNNLADTTLGMIQP
jgi:flagellar hook-associated protein 1